MPARLLTLVPTLATASAPTVNPEGGDLPGTALFQHLANGVDDWALIAAILGVIIGAVIWAFGHYSQNYQQAYNGRKGVMVSGIAALLMGAAPKVIYLLFEQGRQVK